MGKCAENCRRGSEVEFAMFDRHWFGDLALAVLLVLPLTGLARTHPTTHHTGLQTAATNATADLSRGGRIGLMG
jgi:hypothetical protein